MEWILGSAECLTVGFLVGSELLTDRLEALYAESERSRVVEIGDEQYGTGRPIPENGRPFRGITESGVNTEGEYEFDLRCGPSTRGDAGRDCQKGN